MTNQHINKAHITVDERSDGVTLQTFVAAKRKISRRKSKELIDSRCVLVNRRRVWMCNHRLKCDDSVEISAGIKKRAAKELPTLFRDDFCIIIDKPPGLLSDGIDSAEQALREQTRNPALLAVHRLDRDTSGCLMFATDPEAKRKLVPVFRSHSIKKIYQAIVTGNFKHKDFKCSEPIDGKTAITHFRMLDSGHDASHIQARIETGRTHQIRKHLASIGHYVMGDRYYGVAKKVSNKDMKIRRQMLHASSLEFMSPLTNKRVRAKSSLPGDFRKSLSLFNLS